MPQNMPRAQLIQRHAKNCFRECRNNDAVNSLSSMPFQSLNIRRVARRRTAKAQGTNEFAERVIRAQRHFIRRTKCPEEPTARLVARYRDAFMPTPPRTPRRLSKRRGNAAQNGIGLLRVRLYARVRARVAMPPLTFDLFHAVYCLRSSGSEERDRENNSFQNAVQFRQCKNER